MYICSRSYAAWKLHEYPSEVKKPVERQDTNSAEYEYDDDDIEPIQGAFYGNIGNKNRHWFIT